MGMSKSQIFEKVDEKKILREKRIEIFIKKILQLKWTQALIFC